MKGDELEKGDAIERCECRNFITCISCPSLWDAEAWNAPAESTYTSTADRHPSARNRWFAPGQDPDDIAQISISAKYLEAFLVFKATDNSGSETLNLHSSHY
jgi:hypothetical protein